MTSPVVLGVGGCVDYEIRLSSGVLEELVDTYGISADELTSTRAVVSERDLVVSILAYVRQGGGGEHFVASSDALHDFAGRFPEHVTLGGTSVRAGLTMSRLGVPSTLHLVTVNRYFRELLPATCEHIGGDDEETLYPHLIVQYPRGLHVRAGDVDVRAPFPNRLIYVNDPANELLPISDELGSALEDARVFLISGFNAIRDQEVLGRRLSTLRHHMRRLPPQAFVYYEDAAFHVPEYNDRVREALLDSLDVFGLNEDEMETLLGHPVDLLSVSTVEKALTLLRSLVPGPTLVVHTKHWSAAVGERADEYLEALEAGIRTASTRYCFGDDYTDAEYESMRGRPRQTEAVELAASLEARMGSAVRCVPGLELDVADPTTIGLGDTFVGGFLAAVTGRVDVLGLGQGR